MKSKVSFVAVALAAAVSVNAYAHGIQQHHRRTGPSAVPPAPPPQPTASSTPPVDVVAGSKRGVSFNDVAATKNFGSKIVWAYNWDSQHSGTLNSGVEYVPMLWDNSPDHTAQWNDHATAAIAAGATTLLGFNEPDLQSQADLSPSDAAAAWKTWMEPFAGKAKLCSPAVTNGGAPMGVAWLDEFFAACTGCTIDCVAIHIYDSAVNEAYFQNYVKNVAQHFGKPVWLTEFGASGTTQQQQLFLSTFLPFLDNNANVARYSYFMAAPGILVDSSDNLSPLGQTYNTV